MQDKQDKHEGLETEGVPNGFPWYLVLTVLVVAATIAFTLGR